MLVCVLQILNGPYNIRNCHFFSNFPDSLKSAMVKVHCAMWTIFIETIPYKEWASFNAIFQGIFSTSSIIGWGIFFFNSFYSTQELILFLCSNSGSLVCHIISGKHFWKNIPCSPLPLPISNKERFFYDFG